MTQGTAPFPPTAPVTRELLPKSVAFLATADWFFLSHRLALAQALISRGVDVHVVAPETGLSQRLARAGLNYIPLDLARHGTNPFVERQTMRDVRAIYEDIRPSLIHNISTKPIIYGTHAARNLPNTAIINAITGLGFPLSSHWKARLIAPFTKALYRRTLRSCAGVSIFQTAHDLRYFVGQGLVDPSEAVVIPGAGINPTEFRYTPYPGNSTLVLLVARMLRTKGIREFAEAARIVKNNGVSARFVIVGPLDTENSLGLSVDELRSLESSFPVEWWGPRDDVAALMREAAVIVLPTTHPEGVPKVLIEAAAIGRPIVATNAPGCRYIVRHRKSGYLVESGSSSDIASHVASLLQDKVLARQFGAAGARFVAEHCTDDIIIDKTLEAYSRAAFLAGQ